MTMTLSGWRVLIPRTPEQSLLLRQLLAAQGAEPIAVPTITITAPDDPSELDRAIATLADQAADWLVLTSANAVSALRARRPELPDLLGGTRVAAVGAATAAAASQWGLTVELIPSGAQNSSGLAAEFPVAPGRTGIVVVPRSDLAGHELPAALAAKGWTPLDVVAYRTQPAPPPPRPVIDLVTGGGMDAVLFTSSSTVTGLLDHIGRPHSSTVIASIGPRTSDTCRERGLRVDLEAATPSAAELTAALVVHAQEHPRAPKNHPRAPKNHPRAPKNHPRAPKNHPRALGRVGEP